MEPLKDPERLLGNLDTLGVARLLTAASDITLVVGDDGVIRDVVVADAERDRHPSTFNDWVGRPLKETVTVESRDKVDALLDEASASGPTPWRHLNHPTPEGRDLPVMYAALRTPSCAEVVMIGRDLRVISQLQQRLVEAQLSMEREYESLRQMETRYRLLFQTSQEAVLILDGATLRITEANPAALQMMGQPRKRLVGRPLGEAFDAASNEAIQGLLAAARAAGRADPVAARLADIDLPVTAAAALVRQAGASTFLIRMMPADPRGAGADPDASSRRRLGEVMASVPDAFVVTDTAGRILTVNRAFLDLAQLVADEQPIGESLDRWLGRPGVDLNVLIANLRERGAVRLFATILRGEFGSTTEVEVSAGGALAADAPCLGFVIRNVAPRLAAAGPTSGALPRSVEQLTELVGRVSLKDIVRDTTDAIEKLCIEAALELTSDNRASAAEMLGLSRQSLYVKLRRYGLGDLAGEAET